MNADQISGRLSRSADALSRLRSRFAEYQKLGDAFDVHTLGTEIQDTLGAIGQHARAFDAFVQAPADPREDQQTPLRLKHVAQDLDQLAGRLDKLKFAVFVFLTESSADEGRAPVGMRSAGIDAAIAFAQGDILVMERRLTALAGYYRSGELLEEDETDRNDLPLADALAHYDPLRPGDTVHFAGRERDPRRVSEEPSGERPRARPFRVPVMFATDRRKLAESSLSQVNYTNSRGDGALAYGVTEVSIPGNNRHTRGRVERPSLWKWWDREDPEKHITIVTCEEKDLATWATIARERIEEAGASAALVFIHGFNVSFREAIRHAAQIGWDLQFHGLITAFSWCSKGNVTSYFADEPNARRAAPRFLDFVRVLRKNARVKTIHVIAHSMGNVVLLEALRKMPRSRKHKAALEEVVLAAPDYDAGELKDALKELGGKARRYTLYGSEHDLPLVFSRMLRGNYHRAGDGGLRLLVVDGIESIDATAVGGNLLGLGLGHSYFASTRTVLSDLFYVIRDGMPPSRRNGLDEKQQGPLKYWVFVP